MNADFSSSFPSNKVPFKNKSHEINTDDIFKDRNQIFSMLNSEMEFVTDPSPSYIKPLRSYLDLDYSEENMLALMSWVLL